MRHHHLRPAHSWCHAGRRRPCPPPSRNSRATCFSRIGILVYSPANLIKNFDKLGRETVDVREFQWVEEVVRQCNRTLRGKQDLADCVSSGLLWLRDNGFLELEHEFIKAELERKAWRPQPVNIGKLYGVV